ncbi:MAG: methyltransferase domain-containing protein [Desulfovibrionaceae bacterium]
MDHTSRKIGQFWDERTSNPLAARVRWWQSPRIIAHVNRLVCGEEAHGASQGAIRLLQSLTHGQTFERGLSIGCGGASKELDLVKQNIVHHFDLYELSQTRVELALMNFSNAGLSDNMTISNKNFFEDKSKNRYDFIHWDNALHHMLNCDEAIAKTCECLRPGGCFFMNDYVGKSRFQWSDEELSYINHFRRSLPDRVFHSLDGQIVSKEITRPPLDVMLKTDPSEAADSESIIPSLKRRLNSPKIVTTGGSIYHAGLNDILANIEEDSPILTHALTMDEFLNNKNIYQYAVCIDLA